MKSPIMKEIEKLVKDPETQMRRALQRIEKKEERFEAKCRREEDRIEKEYHTKGIELEKKIKEMAEKNGMLCFIGTNTSPYLYDHFWKPLKSIGGLDLARPSGKRGSIAILPVGSKEKFIPKLSIKGTWLIGPKGELLIHKSELGLCESE